MMRSATSQGNSSMKLPKPYLNYKASNCVSWLSNWLTSFQKSSGTWNKSLHASLPLASLFKINIHLKFFVLHFRPAPSCMVKEGGQRAASVSTSQSFLFQVKLPQWQDLLSEGMSIQIKLHILTKATLSMWPAKHRICRSSSKILADIRFSIYHHHNVPPSSPLCAFLFISRKKNRSAKHRQEITW